jgi:microcompartment protein CcmK/EutM
VLGAIAALIGGLVFLFFGAVLLIAYELGGEVDPAGLAQVVGVTVAGAGLGTWGVWLIARGGRARSKRTSMSRIVTATVYARPTRSGHTGTREP